MKTIENLKESLNSGVVKLRFVKSDGSIRSMRATTNRTLFSYEFKGEGQIENSNITTMWDLDKNAWRRMKNDSLIEWATE